MRILVLGSNGQLGSEILWVMQEHDLISATHAQIDISQSARMVEFASPILPEVIINAAGYTDIDGFESSRERAFLDNAIGACNAAIAVREVGADLIHISTNYVFDGNKDGPYIECDLPRTLNIYGWSKLLGERMAMEQNPNTFILRIAWLYGSVGRNFPKTILTLAREKEEICVVNDQWGTPSYVEIWQGRSSFLWIQRAMACTIVHLREDAPGMITPERSFGWLSSRSGSCLWPTLHISARLGGLPTASWTISCSGRWALDIMPEWKDSLARHIGEIKESLKV